jgi:hypothetical protein
LKQKVHSRIHQLYAYILKEEKKTQNYTMIQVVRLGDGQTD